MEGDAGVEDLAPVQQSYCPLARVAEEDVAGEGAGVAAPNPEAVFGGDLAAGAQSVELVAAPSSGGLASSRMLATKSHPLSVFRGLVLGRS